MTLSSQSKVCKVLMVDDETLFLELMETILADLKLEVVRASNAKEAIELVEAHSPDLIITDTNMPLGSGIDLIRSVRERNNLTPIIIFFDGSHFDPQLKPGDILNMGANAILTKLDMFKSLKIHTKNLLKLNRKATSSE